VSGMLLELTRTSTLTAIPVSNAAEQVVCREQTWMSTLNDDANSRIASDVSASRWAGYADEAREEISAIEPDCHVLGIALCPMDVTLFAREKLIHDGRVQQGMMRLNEPGLALRAIFRGGYDTLHLHIGNDVIADCAEAGCGKTGRDAIPGACSQLTLDPVIERLARALTHADDFGGAFGRCYADSIGLAIVARLLGRTTESRSGEVGPRVASLPKWRLKRVTDFIAAHLNEPIGLAEMARSTGLTRMHFAAQFRASTGLRPHEYLVRRRIERAQELLAACQLPLAEIALEVGFRAQAHFTTVFAKIVGETPNAWRKRNYTDLAGGFVTLDD
jgi:AraC family transcriptional regulator